jgi:phosphoglycolate phosphatase-like HAD superfamily hydrolase
MGAHSPDFVAVDWNGTVVPFFGLPPYAGALATLAALRARGVPVFIVSRASNLVIQADVARVGLAAEAVIGCEDKAPVLSDLRAQHGHGLYLGDTAADARAAAAAGLPFLQACLDGQPPLSAQQACFGSWAEAALLLAGGGGKA